MQRNEIERGAKIDRCRVNLDYLKYFALNWVGDNKDALENMRVK